jgi:hypothetical protein
LSGVICDYFLRGQTCPAGDRCPDRHL